MARRRHEERTEPLNRFRQVNPAGPIYDVKAGGHTIEWTDDIREAIAAYVSAHRRDRQVWRLVNGEKHLIDVRAAI
jgi:hypothetical protein